MIRLIHGTFPEAAAEFADGFFDHVITDPPYSEHVHKNAMSGGRRHRLRMPHGTRIELGYDHISEEQIGRYAQEFARLVKRWIIVFSDLESAHLWNEAFVDAEIEPIRIGIWVKLGAMPQFSGDRPGSGAEAIVIGHKPGKKSWYGGGRPAVYTIAREAGAARIQDGQKPLGLMEMLLLHFTGPQDMILDPFAGSFTTGVAAFRDGRSCVGIECDEQRYNAAKTRIERAMNNGWQDSLWR